jgi:anti-anti-sigma factor
MEAEVREVDGVTVIAPHGPLDVGAALDFRNLLAGPIGVSGNKVIVDLSSVSLVDSSGVGVLVTAHRQAEAAGAAFAIAGAVGPVGRVFEMTRTNKLLSIHDSVDDGIASLRDV